MQTLLSLTKSTTMTPQLCFRAFSSTATGSKQHPSSKRPAYKDILHKSKHHLAELIEEDCPLVFMNQDRYDANTIKAHKFKLDSEMKVNFFQAYRHFLGSLSDYSQS